MCCLKTIIYKLVLLTRYLVTFHKVVDPLYRFLEHLSEYVVIGCKYIFFQFAGVTSDAKSLEIHWHKKTLASITDIRIFVTHHRSLVIKKLYSPKNAAFSVYSFL